MRLSPDVVRRVRGLLLDRLSPLLIYLDADARIDAWSGDPRHYGLDACRKGMDCRDLLPELHGIELARAFDLPFVETRTGGSMDLHLLPLPDAAALLVVTDTTEARDWRQRVQQQANEISLLNHRQEKLLERLARADELKSRFIAGMSHEFRTPLAAIQGQLALMRDASPALDAQLDTLDANAAHLLGLIDNILDQARIESGALVLQPQDTDLVGLSTELRHMFVPAADLKGLGFRMVGPEPGTPRVKVDAMRLRQVLVNLLGNAFKYTDHGEVALRLAWGEGRLSASIRDTGPGIPGASRRRIFEAFHQEPGAREGVGLGLAISDRLVRLMGGRLSLESTPGRGSEFSFQVDAPAVPENRRDPVSWRVLVADDAQDLRRLFMHLLRKDGWQVVEADSAQRTLSLAAAEAPDAVLLDLYLGQADGCEVAAELRARGYTGVILMLSASSEPEDALRARRAGCDDFLLKTVGAAHIRARLGELLDN